MAAISIMQGRLSPAEGGRFQFFPTDWPVEFRIAKELGFDGLTWFLDIDRPNHDPIKDIWQNTQALKQIDEVSRILPLRGMDCGLVSLSRLKEMLPTLAGRLVNGTVCVPLLEKMAPQTKADWSKTATELKELASAAKAVKLRIALETEITAKESKAFLAELNYDNVGVCYDIGNAASCGFDTPAEIRESGDKIFEVHLKDRRVGSSQSVVLGQGDGKFKECFQTLKDIGYNGGFTLQAWRGENYLADAKNQLAFVKNLMKELNYD